MVHLWNTSVIQDTLYKATIEYFVIRMDNGDLLPPANKVPHIWTFGKQITLITNFSCIFVTNLSHNYMFITLF